MTKKTQYIKQAAHDLPPLMTVKELQSFLSIGRSAVYKLLKENPQLFITVQNRHKIITAGVIDYLNECGTINTSNQQSADLSKKGIET